MADLNEKFDSIKEKIAEKINNKLDKEDKKNSIYLKKME